MGPPRFWGPIRLEGPDSDPPPTNLTPASIMSLSPPIRRLSTASQREEALIYQYEAEEERIINVLSRKLEQLQDEKGRYSSGSTFMCNVAHHIPCS